MTIEEAIKITILRAKDCGIDPYIDDCGPREAGFNIECGECDKAVAMVEDLLDKDKAVMPYSEDGFICYCPRCGDGVHQVFDNDIYCSKCGQRIDWNGHKAYWDAKGYGI